MKDDDTTTKRPTEGVLRERGLEQSVQVQRLSGQQAHGGQEDGQPPRDEGLGVQRVHPSQRPAFVMYEGAWLCARALKVERDKDGSADVLAYGFVGHGTTPLQAWCDWQENDT